MWFLKKLDNNYFFTTSYTINYKNLPEEKIIINKIPTKLYITLYGNGFELLKVNFFSERKINIDLHLSPIVNNTILFNTNLIIQELKKELPTQIQIIKIEPQNIKLYLQKLKYKIVKVVPKILTNHNLIAIDSIVCNPKYIIIKASENYLKNINYIETVPIYLNKPIFYIEKVKLKKIKNVFYSKHYTNVNIYYSTAINDSLILSLDKLNGHKKNFFYEKNSILIKYKIEQNQKLDKNKCIAGNITYLTENTAKINLSSNCKNLTLIYWEPQIIKYLKNK